VAAGAVAAGVLVVVGADVGEELVLDDELPQPASARTPTDSRRKERAGLARPVACAAGLSLTGKNTSIELGSSAVQGRRSVQILDRWDRRAP
jgi:hypothetical protein